MSYDPTQWAPQTPDQQPAQPPVTPPAYQAPQPPAQPAYGQPQYPGVPPTAYGQPGTPGTPSYGGTPSNPGYGQPSSPSYPGYGQPSSPSYPGYGQSGQGNAPTQPSYGQPSSPAYPGYGQPGAMGQPAYGQPGIPGQPAYGTPSSPAYPAYGQPSSPAYPAYGQPVTPGFDVPAEQAPAWGASIPPGYVPPAPAPKKKSPVLLIVIIVLVVVLVGGGGGGYAWYLATRPKPVITMTSQYLDGATLVGATGTSFTLTGKDFTANSAITFLLDTTPLQLASPATSQSNGDLSSVTLPVTSTWAVGNHTLTAQDASNYVTKLGIKVEIVNPGQTKTPGPNGSPTDSATMSISANITVNSSSGTTQLTVKNGSVCATADDGQPHSTSGTDTSGVTYTESITKTCSGTYQAGKLTYTETASGLRIVYSDGLICGVARSFINRHLDGTFTSATALNGAYSTDAITLSCNMGVGNLPIAAETGTWTGVAVLS
ncbi:MAG TPA: hypothetical protein VGD98_01730 [Ktedonobacteraceae bacterium]